jgi:hypothetical protein
MNNITDKEQKIIEYIAKAKQKLAKLKQKRIKVAGKLVHKHGLDKLNEELLDQELKTIAEKFKRKTTRE